MLNGPLAGSGPKAKPSSIRLTGAARSSSGPFLNFSPLSQLGYARKTSWAVAT
jgi:hypothetical protein